MTSIVPVDEPLWLPDNLPDISKARLPAVYESAKTALAECSRLDECQDWADKMEAMSSYARQAQDDELRRMCDRIQARASRRVGELLDAMKPGKTGPKLRDGSVTQLSRKDAASKAGLSDRQRVTSLRIAKIPQADFEAAIESDKPPTVTTLAKRGTKKLAKTRTVRGLHEADFVQFATIIGACKQFVRDFTNRDMSMLRATLEDDERDELRSNIDEIRDIVDSIEKAVWQ